MSRVRVLVSAGSKPYFPRGVRMRYDTVRERIAVLGPDSSTSGRKRASA